MEPALGLPENVHAGGAWLAWADQRFGLARGQPRTNRYQLDMIASGSSAIPVGLSESLDFNNTIHNRLNLV